MYDQAKRLYQEYETSGEVGRFHKPDGSFDDIDGLESQSRDELNKLPGAKTFDALPLFNRMVAKRHHFELHDKIFRFKTCPNVSQYFENEGALLPELFQKLEFKHL